MNRGPQPGRGLAVTAGASVFNNGTKDVTAKAIYCSVTGTATVQYADDADGTTTAVYLIAGAPLVGAFTKITAYGGAAGILWITY